MSNRFPKTSRNVQGGIMRPPSDGGLKKPHYAKLISLQWYGTFWYSTWLVWPCVLLARPFVRDPQIFLTLARKLSSYRPFQSFNAINYDDELLLLCTIGQFANHIIALCTMPWSSVCQAADSRWDMADTIIAGHWFGPALSSILTPMSPISGRGQHPGWSPPAVVVRGPRR